MVSAKSMDSAKTQLDTHESVQRLTGQLIGYLIPHHVASHQLEGAVDIQPLDATLALAASLV